MVFDLELIYAIHNGLKSLLIEIFVWGCKPLTTGPPGIVDDLAPRLQTTENEKLITREAMEKGINDLLVTSKGDGTFCYTFFKGVGAKPRG